MTHFIFTIKVWNICIWKTVLILHLYCIFFSALYVKLLLLHCRFFLYWGFGGIYWPALPMAGMQWHSQDWKSRKSARASLPFPPSESNSYSGKPGTTQQALHSQCLKQLYQGHWEHMWVLAHTNENGTTKCIVNNCSLYWIVPCSSSNHLSVVFQPAWVSCPRCRFPITHWRMCVTWRSCHTVYPSVFLICLTTASEIQPSLTFWRECQTW